MKLGNKIRKIREMRELKQEYVAEKLSISVNSYGKIERDEVEINFTRAEQIATIFSIKLTTLINFSDEALWEIFDKNENTEVYRILIKNLQDTIQCLNAEKSRLLCIIEKSFLQPLSNKSRTLFWKI